MHECLGSYDTMANPRTRQLCWALTFVASNLITAAIVASQIRSPANYTMCPTVASSGSTDLFGTRDESQRSPTDSTALVTVSCSAAGGGASATPFQALLNPTDRTLCRCAPPIANSPQVTSECPTPPTTTAASSSSTLGSSEVDENMPRLFLITPTYSRPTQKVDLTSLCQTLMLVPKVLWIIVEDSDYKTDLMANLLKRCPVEHAHLTMRTPEMYRPKKGKSSLTRNRGVEQRNKGLQYVRQASTQYPGKGVVYFADDDNKYDIRLFEEIRKTEVASVLPVAFAGGLKVEGPVCENGKAVKWHASWGRERAFPIDMAGIAVNVRIFLEHPSIEVGVTAKGGQTKLGYLETDLLSQFTSRDSVECRGTPNEVYVWHTKTEKPNFVNERYRQTDPKIEYR